MESPHGFEDIMREILFKKIRYRIAWWMLGLKKGDHIAIPDKSPENMKRIFEHIRDNSRKKGAFEGGLNG